MGRFFLKRDHSFLLVLASLSMTELLGPFVLWFQVLVFLAVWFGIGALEDLWARAQADRRSVDYWRTIADKRGKS